MNKHYRLPYILILILYAFILSSCADDTAESDEAAEPLTCRELIEDGIKLSTVLGDSSNVVFYDNSFYINPDVTDDELDALVGIIADVSSNEQLIRENADIYIKCYSDNVYIDLSEELDKAEIRSDLNGMIDEESYMFQKDFEEFYEKLEEHDVLYRSDSGEWYFLIDDSYLRGRLAEVINTIDDICRYNPMDTYNVRNNSYKIVCPGEKPVYCGVYGDSISLYRKSYEPENKIDEWLMIDAAKLYDEVLQAAVCYEIEENSSIKINGKYDMQFTKGKLGYCFNVIWEEDEEEISMDKLVTLTYGLYNNLHSVTTFCQLPIDINITATASEGVDDSCVERLYAFNLDASREYTKYRWKSELSCYIIWEYIK